MPLPDDPESPWPPPELKDVYARYREHAAWYSGSPNALSNIYYAGGGKSAGFLRTNFDRFWARSPAPQGRLMVHVPIAAALATVSSDLLFAEPPDFLIPETDENGKAIPDGEKIQSRLNELVERESIYRTLSAAAETVAALGGGFLRVVWDDSVSPENPMLSSVDADAAVPDFAWDRLQAVTFWKVIKSEPINDQSPEKEVWRLLERHEPGRILYGLYMGNTDKLGIRQPLDAGPGIGIGVSEEIETGFDELTAVYIPNIRPNRVFRGSPLGRSDYDGVEASMDALDEASTSLMRDLRLARARLIIPQELVTADAGKGKGGTFDLDQEVWEAAPLGVPMAPGKDLITPSQFAIRATDHLAVIRAKLQEIVVSAGYSNASFGYENGPQVVATATEIVNRERQSFLTRSKKVSYWTKPLEQILYVLLLADSRHFGGPGAARPKVLFADSINDDIHEMATVVQILATAQAASTEVKVRMVHPKWTDAQVAAEVKKIEASTPAISGRPGPTGETNPAIQNGSIPPSERAQRLGNFGPGAGRVAAGSAPERGGTRPAAE